MYDWLLRFDQIRRLLGHTVRLSDQQWQALKSAPFARLGDAAWPQLTASYLECLQANLRSRGSRKGLPLLPRYTEFRELAFETRTGGSRYVVGPGQLRLDRSTPLNPSNGRHGAIAWLLGDALDEMTDRAVVEAYALLCGLGLKRLEIESLALHAGTRINSAECVAVISNCALGALVALQGRRQPHFARAIRAGWEALFAGRSLDSLGTEYVWLRDVTESAQLLAALSHPGVRV